MRSIILLASLVDLIAGQKCAPVHMIVARGSGEARGEGVTSKLSTAVKGALPGTTSEALDYPAKMPYNGSMAVGSVNLKKVITNYTAACPSSKIVLAGYSQGGSVTLDALCGGGGHPEIGPITKGMTKEEGRNIKAVVAFGEPRFVAGMSYGAGTEAQKSGLYARAKEDAKCPVFAPIIRSWCDVGDIRCASGDSWAVHGQYLQKYMPDIVTFIVEKVK